MVLHINSFAMGQQMTIIDMPEYLKQRTRTSDDDRLSPGNDGFLGGDSLLSHTTLPGYNYGPSPTASSDSGLVRSINELLNGMLDWNMFTSAAAQSGQTNVLNWLLSLYQMRYEKQESELSYQRSLPTEQLKNLMATGMGRQAALAALTGAQYTPAEGDPATMQAGGGLDLNSIMSAISSGASTMAGVFPAAAQAAGALQGLRALDSSNKVAKRIESMRFSSDHYSSLITQKIDELKKSSDSSSYLVKDKTGALIWDMPKLHAKAVELVPNRVFTWPSVDECASLSDLCAFASAHSDEPAWREFLYDKDVRYCMQNPAAHASFDSYNMSPVGFYGSKRYHQERANEYERALLARSLTSNEFTRAFLDDQFLQEYGSDMVKLQGLTNQVHLQDLNNQLLVLSQLNDPKTRQLYIEKIRSSYAYESYIASTEALVASNVSDQVRNSAAYQQMLANAYLMQKLGVVGDNYVEAIMRTSNAAPLGINVVKDGATSVLGSLIP